MLSGLHTYYRYVELIPACGGRAERECVFYKTIEREAKRKNASRAELPPPSDVTETNNVTRHGDDEQHSRRRSPATVLEYSTREPCMEPTISEYDRSSVPLPPGEHVLLTMSAHRCV